MVKSKVCLPLRELRKEVYMFLLSIMFCAFFVASVFTVAYIALHLFSIPEGLAFIFGITSVSVAFGFMKATFAGRK